MNESPAGFLEAARSILWAFIGVRRRQHGESDSARLKPLQIVIAGILGGAVFVLVLVIVVRVIVMNYTAI